MSTDNAPDRALVGGVVEVVSRLLADQHAIVVTSDLAGTVTGWSTSAGDMLGFAPAETIGRPITQVTDFGLNQGDVAEVLLADPGDVWRGETAVLTRDGQRVQFRLAAGLWTKPAGGAEILTVGLPLTVDAAESRAVDGRLFQALVERGLEVAVVCDRDLVIRYAGPSLEQVFGYKPNEVVGISGWDFTHPDDEESCRGRWKTALAHPGGHVDVEVRVRRSDGSWRWVEARITNLLDDPAVAGVVLNIRDVTRRREADTARANNEQLHKAILQTAQEGVWAVGLDGVTLFANAKMADLLGRTPEELTNKRVWEFFDRPALDVIRQHLALRAEGISDQYEVAITSRRGERRWVRVAGSPLLDGEGVHIANLGMYADITHRKHLEQELARVALYDSLTSLPNRALFFDRLQQLQLDSERTGDDIAVLNFDIDRFKEVNQTHGHAVGDELLAAVADRLQRTIREGDTVARFGADEFVILCPATDSLRARDLAADVCGALQAPFEIAGDRVHISVSVGVAATPHTGRGDLLDGAASARHQAQELGRARVEVHDATMQASADDRLRILAGLQAALDEGGLQVHYQPIVRLSDSAPVGVEALMRWHHPELGSVSPAQFIPIAEDSGVMPRLGAWSLNRACADAARYLPPGVDSWHLAVNFSTRQLADGEAFDVVRDALRETRWPADRLLLEVTETAVVTDSARAISTLRAIRDLGVRIAIDDFGTGYSSLSYLRQFPVDTIKIDRSFVAGMTTDADDLAIVASIVSLAAAVGVQAVAEGVETEEQAEALRRLGCPLAQGFLWSAAVPVADLAETMADIARGQRRTSQTPPPGGQGAPRGVRSPAADEAVVARIIALHQSGASLTTIAAALNADNLTTARGLRWHRSSVARVVADRHFPGMTTLR